MSDQAALDKQGTELAPLLKSDPAAAAAKFGSEFSQMTAADILRVARTANVEQNSGNTFVLGIPPYQSCHVKSADLFIATAHMDANNDFKLGYIKVGNLHFKSDACTTRNFGISIVAIPSTDSTSPLGVQKQISDADFHALEKNIKSGDQWSDSSIQTLRDMVQGDVSQQAVTLEDIHRLLSGEKRELNTYSDSTRLGWIETTDPQSGKHYIYAVLQVNEQSVLRDALAVKQGLETPTAKLVGTFPPSK